MDTLYSEFYCTEKREKDAAPVVNMEETKTPDDRARSSKKLSDKVSAIKGEDSEKESSKGEIKKSEEEEAVEDDNVDLNEPENAEEAKSKKVIRNESNNAEEQKEGQKEEQKDEQNEDAKEDVKEIQEENKESQEEYKEERKSSRNEDSQKEGDQEEKKEESKRDDEERKSEENGSKVVVEEMKKDPLDEESDQSKDNSEILIGLPLVPRDTGLTIKGMFDSPEYSSNYAQSASDLQWKYWQLFSIQERIELWIFNFTGKQRAKLWRRMSFSNEVLRKFIDKSLPDMKPYLSEEYTIKDVWLNLSNGLPFVDNQQEAAEVFDPYEPLRHKVKLVKGTVESEGSASV
eukprot:TRINITY_DN569_c0_g2_i1.p1 TRINITY_DN569_c0_g2~~TRINITY_DN569_c0_g2_i1.p1  ORF type:complete len:346 (+),score=147.13 TRINITY_DN569_c0_g2_i1:1-1038(+)